MRGTTSQNKKRHRNILVAISLSVVLIVSAINTGCGRNKKYIPATATARQALEAALTAWRNGQAAGTIRTISPPVQVVDSHWLKGWKLADYEILNEESRDDGNRWFTVRLHPQNTSTTQDVHYVVVGRSPLWVYRQEDFERAHNWEGY